MLNKSKQLTVILLIALLAQACSGDERKKLAQASDDFARGISTALALDDALIRQQLISKDDALTITSAILQVNQIARQFNDRAKTYGTSGGSTKAELLKLAGDLSASLATLNQTGTLKIKNPNSQAQFQAALAVLNSALAIIQGVLGGTK